MRLLGGEGRHRGHGCGQLTLAPLLVGADVLAASSRSGWRRRWASAGTGSGDLASRLAARRRARPRPEGQAGGAPDPPARRPGIVEEGEQGALPGAALEERLPPAELLDPFVGAAAPGRTAGQCGKADLEVDHHHHHVGLELVDVGLQQRGQVDDGEGVTCRSSAPPRGGPPPGARARRRRGSCPQKPGASCRTPRTTRARRRAATPADVPARRSVARACRGRW